MANLRARDQKLFDAIADPSVSFELLEELGTGAFGSVWSASLKGTKVKPAVKIVSIEPGQDQSEYRQEVDLMRSLRNDYIIYMYGAWISGNELWIAMERAEISVLDLMRVLHRPMSEHAILSISQHAARALAYLHDRGIVHRDLKCGNILLVRDGSARLCDFGVSAVVKDDVNKRRTVVGSPYWMAPEVIKEVGYAQPADIWGLAITMIEMAEMDPPLSDMHPMRVIFLIPTNAPPTLTNTSDWSKDFNTIISACLQKDPKARPSAKQLLRAPWFVKGPKSCIKKVTKAMKESQARIKQCGGIAEAMEQRGDGKEDGKFQEEPAKDSEDEVEEEDEVDLSDYLGGVDTFIAKPAATSKKKKKKKAAPTRRNLGNITITRSDSGEVKAQAVKKKKKKKRRAVSGQSTVSEDPELAKIHAALRSVGLEIKAFRSEMLENVHIREEAMTRLQEFTRRLQELSRSPHWSHSSCAKYTSRIERSREKATEIMLKIDDSEVMVHRVAAMHSTPSGSRKKKRRGSGRKSSADRVSADTSASSPSPLRVDAAKNAQAEAVSPRKQLQRDSGAKKQGGPRKSGSRKKPPSAKKKDRPPSSPKKGRKQKGAARCPQCKWQVPQGLTMKFCGQCSAALE